MMRIFTSIVDASKVERANSFRQMMQMSAWREFDLFLENERASALEQAIISEDMEKIRENRGKVKQIDAIRSHLGFILNDPSTS